MIKRKLLSGGFKKANAVICPFPPCLFACLRWLIFARFFPMLSIIFVHRHSGSLDLRCSAPVPSVFVILCAQHHYFIICELKAASAKIIVEFTLFARKQLCPGAESVIFGLSAILRAAVRQNTPSSFQRKTLDKHRDM